MTTDSDGIVLFDGVCNLCARSVRFILEHERAPAIRFASIQSVPGGRLMRALGLDPDDAKTFVLIADGAAYTFKADPLLVPMSRDVPSSATSWQRTPVPFSHAPR